MIAKEPIESGVLYVYIFMLILKKALEFWGFLISFDIDFISHTSLNIEWTILYRSFLFKNGKREKQNYDQKGSQVFGTY